MPQHEERPEEGRDDEGREEGNVNGKRLATGSRVQGEGDYVSGKKYQKRTAEFARSHDTEQLAREAAPRSEDEIREMAEAERLAKARAKGGKKDAPG